MSKKKKHILDWYEENTPSDEKKYDKGVLIVGGIVFCIFYGAVIAMLLIEK